MFPPSDSQTPESIGPQNSGSAATAVEEHRQAGSLTTTGGGLSPLAGMPWSFGYPTRPEILSAKPTMANLAYALRRRLGLAILLGLLLGGGLAAAGWFFTPVPYESAARLQVHIQNPTIWHDLGGIDFEAYKRNAISIIKAQIVLTKALDDRSIHELPQVKRNSADPVSWLSDSLMFDNQAGSELLGIALRSDDPKGLPEIVNAVVQAYMTEVVDRERDNKLRRRDKLEKKLRDFKSRVLAEERQLYELNQQIGVSDVHAAAGRVRLQDENLNQLFQSRSELQRMISDLSMKMELLKLMAASADVSSIPEEDLEAAISRDPQIQQAMQQMALLTRQMAEVRKTVKRNNDPAVVRIQEEMNNLEQSVREMRAADRQQLIEQYKENGKLNGTNMKGLEVQLGFYQQKLKETNDALDKQAEAVHQLEKFSGDADQLRADIDQLHGVIRDMDSTIEQWNVELDAEPRVEKYEVASPAKLVSPARQYVVSGFLGLLGFGLAIFGVTFLEFHTRRLNSAIDVAHGLGITVMGDLPALRRRAMRAGSRRAIHGLVAESINGIRATLVRNADPDACNTYLVTSAGDGEGKTTVASQLAASLARSGRRTLLIDGDLRHPGAHLVFGLPNDYGFCELLRHEIDVADAILPTPADGLWLIPAGQCCAVSLMALGKDVAAEVLSQLKTRFEFIVIDTGPVLKVADPLMLGQHVDGAILSVLRDVSQIHKVYEANERLKLAGVKVVGAVINGVDDRGDSDRYNMAHTTTNPA